MLMVNFTVYGPPQGKARPRFRKIGNFVQTYTPAKTKSYEDEIKMFAKAAMGATEPLETPVEVFLYIRNTVPASYSKKRTEACLTNTEKHIKKPDLDNVIKSVIDGMDKIVFLNDSQITSIHSTKVYGEVGKVEVLVREA